MSHILPLHKDGPKNCIENHRPISLLPKVSLIFERILFNYIYSAIKDKLHPKQFGFQAKRGAVLQLLDYLETIYRQSSSILFAVYLDYAKAFDKVPYAILLKKLHTFGMDLNFISLMRSYLLDRTQRVSAQGQLSNALPVLSGVPQGSVLGPLLFLLFIKDLPAIFLDAIPWLLADDLKLLFNTANFHDDLARLHNWNLSNGMLANTAKTKTLNFKSVTDVNLSGINLMNVNSQRDLGVVVTSNLKWDNHIDIRISKARKFFFLLKNTIPWSTPSKTKYNLYRSMVLSVLLYGAVICSPSISSLKKMESFQKLCFRWIFGKKLNYERTLKTNNLLPIAYHIELESHSLLLNLLLNKYAYNVDEIVTYQPRKPYKRLSSFNPLVLSSNMKHSVLRNSVMSLNYLHRQAIISEPHPSSIRSVKIFLLNKTFDFDNTCTYYICCCCAKCSHLKSLI